MSFSWWYFYLPFPSAAFSCSFGFPWRSCRYHISPLLYSLIPCSLFKAILCFAGLPSLSNCSRGRSPYHTSTNSHSLRFHLVFILCFKFTPSEEGSVSLQCSILLLATNHLLPYIHLFLRSCVLACCLLATLASTRSGSHMKIEHLVIMCGVPVLVHRLMFRSLLGFSV